MIDDAVLISLISESVNAPSGSRRKAAVILVQALRIGNRTISIGQRGIWARTEAAEIARELRALMLQYGVPEN